MIAADSSVIIPWLKGESCIEVEHLNRLIDVRDVCLAMATVTEILSSANVGEPEEALLEAAITLPVLPGYWQRAGALRAGVRQRGRRAPFADALVAQACIDADVPLLARDTDFKPFAAFGGLRLA